MNIITYELSLVVIVFRFALEASYDCDPPSNQEPHHCTSPSLPSQRSLNSQNSLCLYFQYVLLGLILYFCRFHFLASHFKYHLLLLADSYSQNFTDSSYDYLHSTDFLLSWLCLSGIDRHHWRRAPFHSLLIILLDL